MAIKTYVLEVIFDDENDECIGLREYIDNEETVLYVDNNKVKLDKKLGKLIQGNIMGLT
jgi:hypothetical protein